LSRDGFKERHTHQQPIALHEFLVPLLQGWDSVFLNSEVEIGGTDQLFNFQVARTLQENSKQKPEMCIMAPIIRGTDGRKMSKTFENAIWLDETPDEMFGKTMSIPDDVMEEWIELLTDLKDLPGHPMNRKKMLAEDIVRQFHGPEKAQEARLLFENLVQNKALPDEMQNIKPDFLMNIVALIRGESNKSARRLIQQGGVSVNGIQIRERLFFPKENDVIKIGKRNFVKIIS